MSTQDVDCVARLFLAEATYHQRIDGYFELDPAFDWHSYVGGLLAKQDRHIAVAERDGQAIAFLYARFKATANNATATTVPAVHRSRLQRLFRRPPSSSSTPSSPPSPSPTTPLRPRTWGAIEQCWVEDEYRRQGLAGQLLEHALQWLRERGASRIELGVSAQNPAAREFWQRHGFAQFRLSMSLSLDEESPSDVASGSGTS